MKKLSTFTQRVLADFTKLEDRYLYRLKQQLSDILKHKVGFSQVKDLELTYHDEGVLTGTMRFSATVDNDIVEIVLTYTGQLLVNVIPTHLETITVSSPRIIESYRVWRKVTETKQKIYDDALDLDECRYGNTIIYSTH